MLTSNTFKIHKLAIKFKVVSIFLNVHWTKITLCFAFKRSKIDAIIFDMLDIFMVLINLRSHLIYLFQKFFSN